MTGCPGKLLWYPAIVPCLSRFSVPAAVAIKIVLALVCIASGNLLKQHPELVPVHAQRILPGGARRRDGVLRGLRLRRYDHAAEESAHDKEHMPQAIIFSLGITMFLYAAATPVLTGMQNYRDIDPTDGLASALNVVGLPVSATIISQLTDLSILTVMPSFLLGVSRAWFSMSRYGLLPSWFA